ncbi:autotransporter assembly complex family protein [Neochlamydia sp. AcF84]|uniref:autotransporter assembly complex protein TamA n=1 Tax=Neochlamydia sp. AcF84 TaxID=2315858 RepID=UPI00140939AE|nr:autotransporter assembly complex family protein [Neochlamydia sp. AcF84]
MIASFFKILCLIMFIVILNLSLYAIEAYQVVFQGVSSQQTLSLLQTISKTVELQNSPPSTNRGLKRRAEADLPLLIKALHSQAYYQAKVNVEINFNKQTAQVVFKIDTGPIYPLASFEILPSDLKSDLTSLYTDGDKAELGLTLGRPAFPKSILDAEELLILKLEREGYPLAKIVDREVIADQSTHSIYVVLRVNTGPKCYFGEVKFLGLQRVSSEFVSKKIAWHLGDIYHPTPIERTHGALEATGLFSSISLTHLDSASQEGLLPIEIEVLEGKHRSIAAGIGYSTDDGIGILGEWEHRNIRGRGEKLSFKALMAQRLQEGTLAYVIPDFQRSKQDLIWLAEFQRQTTKGFHASSFSVSGILERQLNDYTRLSYGGMFKRLRDTHSDNNGNFNLFKIPFQLRWKKTNNILDPTQGLALHVKIIPSLQILHPKFAYCINTFTGFIYLPLTADKRFVFAAKGTFGSIFGKKRHTIPPSERFYAGNENLLRGYHFMTVSPLHDNEPIGGRSMMIYSLEGRWRATETWGGVIFYDFGNVFKNYLPQFNKQILQSAGIGLRYNTPVGPLRIDLAVPLHRRYHIDEKFQVYLSIGQAF